MGVCCSRRREIDREDLTADDLLLDWHLVPLPRVRAHSAPLSTAGPENRRPRSLSSAKCRWVRARLKIKLLRRFRILWSRTGSWLNLHPVGTVDSYTRDRKARLWAGQGKAILVRFITSDLFSSGTRRASRHIRRPPRNTGGRPPVAAVR